MLMNEMFGGGMLTGLEIERRLKIGDIEIDPFNIEQLNPNSYNLRLDKELKIYEDKDFYLDSHKDNTTKTIIIPEEGYILQPGVLYIGRTIERTKSNKLIPMINGRSSGGRLGLSVHICAGFGDIGFDGTWTLEITVVHPLKVYPGDEIAQICYFSPFGDYTYQYKGRYQNQVNATESRFSRKKSEESMAMTYLENREIRDIANTLRLKYGPQEFFNENIDLKTAVITRELMKDEIIECDTYSSKEYIRKLDYDVDGNVKNTRNIIGKVYEIGEGERIYVRR